MHTASGAYSFDHLFSLVGCPEQWMKQGRLNHVAARDPVRDTEAVKAAVEAGLAVEAGPGVEGIILSVVLAMKAMALVPPAGLWKFTKRINSTLLDDKGQLYS